MTRADLLARIATATGHRRKAERIADAETADAVIDAVADWLREQPFVSTAWGGVELLARLKTLRSAAVMPAISTNGAETCRDWGRNGHAP